MLKTFRQGIKKSNTYDMLNQTLFTIRCDDYELFIQKKIVNFFLTFMLLMCLLFITVKHCFQN